MAHYILGISGASGSPLAIKALDILSREGHEVSLVMTAAARMTMKHECGSADILSFLSPQQAEHVTLYSNHNMAAKIASGSAVVEGMLILPCSVATLGALAMGLGDNLLRRAADVTLKERRPLVIALRENPLHAIHLENMLRLSRAGAIIAPPLALWYMKPKSCEEMNEQIVWRLLDSLGLVIDYPRWKGFESSP